MTACRQWGIRGILDAAFEKRHPITHNLGVVDRKYLERAQAAERHGREVRIVATEIEQMLTALSEAIGFMHAALFPSPQLDPVHMLAAGSSSSTE